MIGTIDIEAEVIDTADETRIVLTVDLPDGTHIEPHQPQDPFLIPTVVTVHGLEDVTITYPEPVLVDLGWNDIELTVLTGHLEFQIVGHRTQGQPITGGVTYQPCVGGACLPPRTSVWALDPADSPAVAA
jgi:hypothetical protein